MNFLTVYFAFFILVILTVLSRVTNAKTRNVILLLGNLLFYSVGDLKSVAFISIESIICYFAALYISREKAKDRSGKTCMGMTVVLLVAVLVTTKCFFGIVVLGISFYTLMMISYVVDVYRGKMNAEKDIISVCLYFSFFPQILSGPITKARDMMEQFHDVRPISKDGIYSGMQIFLMGALKKVLIADRLAVCSDAIYGNPGMYSGLSVFFGTICYTIQLYCDFSGYTDMATGVATAMGFKLARNFNMPYIAKNPTETWKRWHMSLSSWLQEYVYISLGGNRKGRIRQYINLILTMIVGGLWHGVALTYVLWGVQCGIGLCAHKLFGEFMKKREVKKSRVVNAMSALFTYLYFTAGTVIFRAESIGDAAVIFRRIFIMADGVKYYYIYFFVYLILVSAAYLTAGIRNGMNGFYPKLDMDRFGVRVLFIFTALIVAIYGYFGNNVFIYAQF